MRLSGGWSAAIAGYSEYQLAMGVMRSSIASRRQQLERVGRIIGVEDPWAVTAQQLLELMAAQPWKPETKRSRRTTLRGFYRWGVESHHLLESPAARLPRVKPSAPNPSPAPDAVYAAALAASGPRERLMLVLAAEHGLRRMEVALVHSRDLVEDLVGWSLVVHGKGGRERMVPLTADAAITLRTLPPGWAFPGRDDGHLSPRWIGKVITRLLPDRWTMHKLRHRAASRWWEVAEGDVFAVQELLGHADPKTTKVYVKVQSARLRAIVDAAA